MPRFDFVDLVNIPTYYMDTAVPEHAGDGNVRIWNCVTRNNVLIPQCEIIIHSSRLIVAAQTVTALATEVVNHDLFPGLAVVAH